MKVNSILHICYYGYMEKGVIPKLNTEMEVRVVVLLAQGYTYQKINEVFQEEFGRTIMNNTIATIKKRNLENLNSIKEKLLARDEADALAIKDRANRMLAGRLKDDEKQDEVLDKARQDYLNEEITLKEYTKILRAHRRVTIPELVSVSKEMHAQGSGGSEQPTTKKDFAALVEAIRSGNEVKLNQVIFNEGGVSDIPDESET